MAALPVKMPLPGSNLLKAARPEGMMHAIGSYTEKTDEKYMAR